MPRKPVYGGYITSGYGKRILDKVEEFHPGIDIGSKSSRPIVQAAYSGTVVKSGFSETFGNRVWVKMDFGYHAVYAHLESINPLIKEGNRIFEGDMIGIMGNTGKSKGRHLHFELRKEPVVGSESIKPVQIIALYETE